MSPSASERVPVAPAVLSAAGLVPFVACTAGLWLLEEPRRHAALTLLCAYGAVILSFVGAVHWGMAMRGESAAPGRAMTFSVVPALLGWFALSIPPAGGLAVLAAGFVLAYLMDACSVGAGVAPRWYRRLRIPLTVAVLACLGAAFAATALRGAAL
jgi:hypothetical protein